MLQHLKGSSARSFVLVLFVVCVLSAGVGTGTTMLLAKTGPEGPAGADGASGAQGPRGARGPEGWLDADDLGVGSLEAEIAGLRETVEELEWMESDVGYLESQIADVESDVSDLCYTLDEYC